MRIQLVIHALQGGGAERVTTELAAALVERGHEVYIVTMGARLPGDYEPGPSVKVVALGVAGKSSSGLAAVLGNLRRIAVLRGATLKIKPDVVLGMMTSSAVLVALATIGLRCGKVGCERGHPNWTATSGTWARLRKVSYPLLDVVTAQTALNAEWLARNIRLRRTAVIPNAITWPRSSLPSTVLPEEFVSPKAGLVLGVGRLDPEKGFDSLIDAFRRAFLADRSWELAILGEGRLRSELEAMISAGGLEGRVHLPGNVGDPAPWYERADVFALSSVSEGFPNVLMEAMASGTPVVAFDCDYGPSELIRPELDGILLPPGDRHALAGALRRLADNPDQRRALAKEGPQVLERFSSHRILAMWEHLLCSVSSSRPAKRRRGRQASAVSPLKGRLLP